MEGYQWFLYYIYIYIVSRFSVASPPCFYGRCILWNGLWESQEGEPQLGQCSDKRHLSPKEWGWRKHLRIVPPFVLWDVKIRERGKTLKLARFCHCILTIKLVLLLLVLVSGLRKDLFLFSSLSCNGFLKHLHSIPFCWLWSIPI